MTLDSVAHLLPRMRAASAEEPVRADFAGLLEVLPSISAGSGSVEVEEPATASNSSVRRTVSRFAVALAASGVFFTGVGSIFMHEAMPMSATMGGQSHRMADGTTMTKAMPTTAPQMDRAPQAAPMPSMPAAAPAADSGPPRPLGAGTAVPIPTTGTSANAMAGPSQTAPTAATTSSTSTSTSTSGRSTNSTPRSVAPSTRPSSTTGAATGARYVVRNGDDFGAVGARFGLSADRIAALNPGIDPTQLSIGQSLRVR